MIFSDLVVTLSKSGTAVQAEKNGKIYAEPVSVLGNRKA